MMSRKSGLTRGNLRIRLGLELLTCEKKADLGCGPEECPFNDQVRDWEGIDKEQSFKDCNFENKEI